MQKKRDNVLSFTDRDLQYIKDRNYSDWTRIMDERNQKELEMLQNEFCTEKSKLESDKKKHAKQIQQKQDSINQMHDKRVRGIKVDETQKIEAVQLISETTKQEYEARMKQQEEKHRQEQQEKEKELQELKAKTEEKKQLYDLQLKEDEELFRQRDEEIDQTLQKQWKETYEKFETDTSEMEAQLAKDQEEFDRKFEEGKIAVKKEFESQIQTEVKITKADGSQFEMREKAPGIVTDILKNMLSSDP